ncbi:MAG: prolyl oligopeptidase family serine peptidase, partial [Lachnospiraceae bacterium]|nr:prolyl oligopeptidase family serine peptidase [Lachnospiraceae bacterium]
QGLGLYHFRTFFPGEKEPGVKYPAVIYLHGGGFNGDDNICHLASTGYSQWMELAKSDQVSPFLLIAPQLASGFFQWEECDCVQSVADYIKNTYPVDSHRIYLVGGSMGGMGVWSIANKNPHMFAALLSAAGVYPDMVLPSMKPIQEEEYAPILKAYAHHLKDVPAWVFHSEADTMAKIEVSNKLAEYMEEEGASQFHYTILPKEMNVDHAGTCAYPINQPEIINWLFQQSIQ